MKQGAVIVAVWLALAAPAFCANLVHVHFDEIGTAAFDLSLPFSVRVENQTGERQYYTTTVGSGFGRLPNNYRGVQVYDHQISSSVNAGGFSSDGPSRLILRFQTLAASDQTRQLGDVDEWYLIRLLVSANRGNSSAGMWKRILHIRDTLVRVTAYRTHNGSRTEPVIVGEWANIDMRDVGQEIVPVPFRNIGDWPVEFRSPGHGNHSVIPRTKWGAAHGSNGGYGLFFGPDWETLYVAGRGLDSGPETWEAGSPGVWQFSTSAGGGDPGDFDLTEATEKLTELTFVVFGVFASCVVVLALDRLFSHA